MLPEENILSFKSLFLFLILSRYGSPWRWWGWLLGGIWWEIFVFVGGIAPSTRSFQLFPIGFFFLRNSDMSPLNYHRRVQQHERPTSLVYPCLIFDSAPCLILIRHRAWFWFSKRHRAGFLNRFPPCDVLSAGWNPAYLTQIVQA